jgi:hypothetical protein
MTAKKLEKVENLKKKAAALLAQAQAEENKIKTAEKNRQKVIYFEIGEAIIKALKDGSLEINVLEKTLIKHVPKGRKYELVTNGIKEILAPETVKPETKKAEVIPTKTD